MNSDKFKGEIYILIAALCNSLLPVFVNSKATDISPYWIAAIGTMISAVFFLGILCRKTNLHELKNAQAFKLSVISGLLIGVLYNGLVHVGSHYTSPQNASILVSFDVFVAMLLFRKNKAESLGLREIIGGILIVTSGIMLFMPKTAQPNIGDLILIAASTLTPVGNLIMKKARTMISSESILFIRAIISSFVLSAVALSVSGTPDKTELLSSSHILILNGLLVLSLSKLFWLEGINLIPIAKASSIMSTFPVMTFLFAWLILNDLPSWNQLIAIPFCVFGLCLLINRKTKNV